jgi:hypothetical protein
VGLVLRDLARLSASRHRRDFSGLLKVRATLIAALAVSASCTSPDSDDISQGRGRLTDSPLPATSLPDPEPTRTPAPNPLVWVAVEGAGLLAKVDVKARRVRRRIDVSGQPHNITVAGRTVVASLPDAGRVALVGRGGLQEVTLGGSPHDVKPAGGQVVVTNEGAARLDLLSRSGRRLGSIPLRANPK